MREFRLFFTALLLALFGSVSVGTAQIDDDTPVPTKSGCTAKALGRHPDPRLLVACFYLPFVDASFMDEDYKSLKLLTAFASRDLKGRLRRESECQIRIGGICSLDYNTSAALAMTGNRFNRSYLVGHGTRVDRLPYCGYFDGLDSAELLARMVSDVSSGIDPPAAILLETIQGEGGINTATSSWLQKLSTLAKEIGSLLIIDDIQSGCGRSGKFFSFETTGIVPDIVCLSKSISGYGLPMALLLIRKDIDVWEPGGHNGTFRGNNLTFVTAAAAIEKFWSTPDFEIEVNTRVSQLSELLDEIRTDSGAEIRGRGMMRGLTWKDPAKATAIAEICARNRLIVEQCGPKDEVIKLLPPINISVNALSDGMGRLQHAIKNVVY